MLKDSYKKVTTPTALKDATSSLQAFFLIGKTIISA
jgi:hypothetical protein